MDVHSGPQRMAVLLHGERVLPVRFFKASRAAVDGDHTELFLSPFLMIAVAELNGDLARTVVVVSSKSGGTLETDSQRRAFQQAFEAAGIDAASRFVVVTDPARDGLVQKQTPADGQLSPGSRVAITVGRFS